MRKCFVWIDQIESIDRIDRSSARGENHNHSFIPSSVVRNIPCLLLVQNRRRAHRLGVWPPPDFISSHGNESAKDKN
jgi:hypothetical protein